MIEKVKIEDAIDVPLAHTVTRIVPGASRGSLRCPKSK